MQIAYDAGYDTISLISPSETELYSILNTLPIKAVFYYGHGGHINNPPLNVYNMHEWTNFEHPVLYFSGGCDFNYNYPGTSGISPPLGDTLMTSTFGSVSSVGASIYGGYGYDYKYIQGIMREIDEQDRMGDLHNRALAYHYSISGSNGIGSFVYYFTRRMNFVGDPYLKIGSPITSVAEQGKSDYINIFPNPVKDVLYIDLGKGMAEMASINIYAIDGRLLSSTASNSRRTRINMNAFEAGIYVLRVTNKAGKHIGTKKIVKE